MSCAGRSTIGRRWLRGKCIGRGSFGTVHLASSSTMKNSDHVFAVKSVRRDTASSSMSQLECLESEIAILRTLSSPYVVRYLGDDTTWEDATSYRNLLMEYMPGGTLADLAGQLDEWILRSYVRCLLSALSYLHSRNITHCDVKGRNVLVVPGARTCKLADFGSAKVLAGITSSEVSPRGSPMWMAPEVIRGEYQGPESDVWSLGCTVIEMMTGKSGWEDKGADTLCRIGFTEELPEVPSWMSEVGRDFLSKCLRREVSERWSCDQLLHHPFVLSSSSCLTDWIEVEEKAETSPRGVLDWVDSQCVDDDDSVSDWANHHCRQYNDINSMEVKSRITELASGAGAVWESEDGWLAVRGWDGDDHHHQDAVSVLEYSNATTTTTTRAEEEIKRRSLVAVVKFGVNNNYDGDKKKNFNLQQRGLRGRGNVLKCGVATKIVEAAAAGWSCGHGMLNELAAAADGQSSTRQNNGRCYCHVNCCCCYFDCIQFYFCGNNKLFISSWSQQRLISLGRISMYSFQSTQTKRSKTELAR